MTLTMRNITWMIIIGMLINISDIQASPNKQPVSCSMTISSPQSLSAGILLNFAIHNPLNENIQLLSWYTPFEGFLSNLFKITDEAGSLINYQGIMVKRLSPEPSDFLLIPAHTKHEIQLDLSKAYSLTSGSYNIDLIYQRLRYKNEDGVLNEFICAPETITVQAVN